MVRVKVAFELENLREFKRTYPINGCIHIINILIFSSQSFTNLKLVLEILIEYYLSFQKCKSREVKKKAYTWIVKKVKYC